MIQFDNVSKSFPSGSLFSGVTLSIKTGVRAGLVGKNGSGKTTLLRMMLGLDSPDSGKIKKEKNLTIGYLQQEIVVGSEKSILEEVLASFPEIDGLGEQIFSLSNQLAESPDNNDIAEELGVLQFKFESMGGWDLEKKSKKDPRWFRFCRMAVQRTNEKIFRWLEDEGRSFKNSYEGARCTFFR